MSVALYTAELAISIYDDVNQRWGPYTDPKNMLSISITKPEPTNIKDVSSRPDDTFAQTTDSFLIGTGSPELTISTRDMVNRESTPVELEMLAAALSARASELDVEASVANTFSFYVSVTDMNYDLGARNLQPGTSMLHKEAMLASGMATGRATGGSATTLEDSSQAWTDSDLSGKSVVITGGTGKGQAVAITGNDATSLTVASWTTPPDATSDYAIVDSMGLVEGSDYTIDPIYGTAKALSAGSINVGDTIHGVVANFGMTGIRFKGAAKDAVTFRARGKAKDIKSGALGFLTLHRVVSYSSAAQEFVANAESPEFKVLELSGEMETPAGQDAPYTFDDNLVYADA
jgi:hypothetical protein